MAVVGLTGGGLASGSVRVRVRVGVVAVVVASMEHWCQECVYARGWLAGWLVGVLDYFRGDLRTFFFLVYG
jgi:hypothetical protein